MQLHKNFNNIDDIFSPEKGDAILNETIPIIDKLYKEGTIHPKKLSIYTIFNAVQKISSSFPLHQASLKEEEYTKLITGILDKEWESLQKESKKDKTHDPIWNSKNPYLYYTMNLNECLTIFSTLYYYMAFQGPHIDQIRLEAIGIFIKGKSENTDIFAKFYGDYSVVLMKHNLNKTVSNEDIKLYDGLCSPIINRVIVPEYDGLEDILKETDSYGIEIESAYKGKRIKTVQLYAIVSGLYDLLNEKSDKKNREITYNQLYNLCGWMGNFNPESIKKETTPKKCCTNKDIEEIIEKTKDIFPSLESKLKSFKK